MSYRKILQSLSPLLLYTLVCLFLFGIDVVKPECLGWLFAGGDLTQHQIGWEAFRTSHWFFPIGMMDTLTYPNLVSVIFTDSIPILAVTFKILSPILPSDFQYFGLWMMLCVLLQGILAFKIIYSFSGHRFFSAVGSLFFVLFPGMLYRIGGHNALAGQWLLLGGFYLVFNYKNYSTGKRIYGIAALLAFLTSSVHIYFTLECGIILVAYCFEDFLSSKNIKRQIFIILDYILTAFVTVALLGGFSSVGSMSADGGLGNFSMNLNALFNPMGWSSILPDLPTYTSGQYEGFGYLGLGGILILCMAICSCFYPRRQKKKTDLVLLGGLIVLIAICLVVALSPIVSFNDMLLYELYLPIPILKLWSIFRSSGRLVVIIGYIALFWALKVIWKTFSIRVATAVILCCLGIQLYDLKDTLMAYHIKYNQKEFIENSLEPKQVWDTLGNQQDLKHVFITSWIGENNYYSVARWAIRNNKTTSSFAIAHPDKRELMKNVEAHLKNPQPDELYLFIKGGEVPFLNENLHYYNAGDYVVGTINGIDDLAEAELK